DVETVSLALIDQVTGNIVFVPELMGALFMEIPPIELKPGEGIAGWVARHGEPLIVNDVYLDKRFYSRSDNLSGFQTHSILCVPLVAEQNVIGVMEAINKRSGDFTTHDQLLLDALSGPLATAIVNARLHRNAIAEKRRIETVFQSMSEGMMTVSHDGYVTAVNDALLTLLHRQRVEVLGKKVNEVLRLRKKDLSEFLYEVMTTTAEPDEYPQLACELKQNGHYVPVLASGAPIFTDDRKVTEMVFAFSDLRQIRELERMRDDFFHSIIHELRTPLALILMYARLLLNGRASNDEEKTERFLRVIERESDRLQIMVRQMLELAKLEASEIQRSSEPISMNDILDEVVPPLADKATEKGLAFIQKIQPDLPQVIGDQPTLYMIFKNLTENAIKFTPTGTVRLDAYTEQDKIVVKVSDEGIGIPEAAIPNLFKRFYRTQTAVERGIAGTGIGLSLVKEGVEKHKGEIVVQSVEDEGTTFIVKLPMIRR
ncbi:MAG: GAF domain-containing protein, partial [Anaerolineales bacterium]|nr:GAF domain-containing protein [Anaerolineales bacterium]